MRPEILSTARPSGLRLAGFLALTLSGALLGGGALAPWAVVTPFTETPVRGIDLWEGKVTLACGAAVLAGMVVSRLLVTRRGRRGVAAAVVLLGVLGGGVALYDAVRADARFSDPGQRDLIARSVSKGLDLPYKEVRAQIEEVFDQRFEVRLQAGIFLTIAGGVLATVGGALTVAWTNRQPLPRSDEESAGT